MENINLTPEEKQELERRWFYAVNLYSVKEYLFKLTFLAALLPHAIIVLCGLLYVLALLITQIPHYIIWKAFSIDFLYAGKLFILMPEILTTIWIIYIIWSITWGFILAGKIFYHEKGVIFWWRNYPSEELSYELIRKTLRKFWFLPLNKNISGNSFSIMNYLNSLWLVIWNNQGPTFMFLIFLIISTDYISIRLIIIDYIVHSGYFWILMSLVYIISVLFIIGISISILHRILNPLYAFWNIGMKIQELAPEIEQESNLIQLEFQKEKNLAVLHSGFNSLSLTFSQIMELVLKLEKVEKRANKGNLFDSEKYIGSLRTDITAPLVELKKFLEKQREELLKSQKELMRVMTGGSSTIQGNVELGDKRGDILLQELNTNIEKLEGMLYKLT